MTGAGVATPGAGAVVVVPKNQSVDGGSNGNQQDTTVPEEYLLTHQAILVIVKSWDVGTYNPPGTNCTSWLGKIHNFCDQYGIPDTQRAPCAMHHMRADCKEAAHSARCYDMTWEEFTVWLRQHDRELRILIPPWFHVLTHPSGEERKNTNSTCFSFGSGKRFADSCIPGRVAELSVDELKT